MRAYDGCATCVVPRFSFGGKTGQASLHRGILVVRAACIPAETLLFLHEEVPRLARTRCQPASRKSYDCQHYDIFRACVQVKLACIDRPSLRWNVLSVPLLRKANYNEPVIFRLGRTLSVWGGCTNRQLQTLLYFQIDDSVT
jgi:hypothetical protein